MSKPKPQVVVLVDWFLPGFKAGGPIRSVAAIVAAFQHEMDFSIITSDRDFGDDQAYPDIQTDQWIDREGYRIRYLSQANSGRKAMKHLLRQTPADVYYFNSLFSLYFTLIPLLVLRSNKGARKVLAPRGMLGAGALALKAGKKQLFLKLARLLGLFRNVHWHASSDQEKNEIQTVFGSSATVFVALNLSQPPQVDAKYLRGKKAQEARFFFLSRISKKKNLLRALQQLSRLPVGGNYSLDILGPIEEEDYWEECQEVISQINDRVKVTHHGAVPFHELSAKLAQFHFLILPTFHENFGHVVLESLACGCPVILSQHTPWRNLASKGVGWDLDLADQPAWDQALESAVSLTESEFTQASTKAREFALQHLNNPATINANRQLFTGA